jgi:hypothetical protein
MITQVTPLHHFFRVLRDASTTPGFQQGICIKELPCPYNASDSLFVKGDWIGIQNAAASFLPAFPIEAPDEGEIDLFRGFSLYGPVDLFTLAPSEIRTWPVQVNQSANLLAKAESYGSSEPLYLEIRQGQTVLTYGQGTTIDESRAAVGTIAPNVAPGSFSVVVTNGGRTTVTVKLGIESINP